MCLQTIGICNLDHSEHLGFHFCSLLISRGLWNPFECSCFEAIEIESYHSSCQTCLEQSVGWKIYNDRSVTLKLWRAVSRKISHHRKRRSKRQSNSGWVGWEMQNVCAVELDSGVPSIRSSKYGYLGDWHYYGRETASFGWDQASHKTVLSRRGVWITFCRMHLEQRLDTTLTQRVENI